MQQIKTTNTTTQQGYAIYLAPLQFLNEIQPIKGS